MDIKGPVQPVAAGLLTVKLLAHPSGPDSDKVEVIEPVAFILQDRVCVHMGLVMMPDTDDLPTHFTA